LFQNFTSFPAGSSGGELDLFDENLRLLPNMMRAFPDFAEFYKISFQKLEICRRKFRPGASTPTGAGSRSLKCHVRHETSPSALDLPPIRPLPATAPRINKEACKSKTLQCIAHVSCLTEALFIFRSGSIFGSLWTRDVISRLVDQSCLVCLGDLPSRCDKGKQREPGCSVSFGFLIPIRQRNFARTFLSGGSASTSDMYLL
jgi:hypothetical protein